LEHALINNYKPIILESFNIVHPADHSLEKFGINDLELSDNPGARMQKLEIEHP